MAEFEFPIRVYWEDTDAGGIVFYANYLKFFERARTEWLRAGGVHQRSLHEQVGGMFVVVESQVKYLRPARLDDELVVTARLQEAGRAGLVIDQQAFVRRQAPEPRELLCRARIRVGWVDAVTLKPARIPPDILKTLPT